LCFAVSVRTAQSPQVLKLICSGVMGKLIYK
jgi:hypothetical protein